MKKTFKRAGVAVLSMAMLLSMGAVGAMSASATGENYTVHASGKLTSSNATYKVYKVADNITGLIDGWQLPEGKSWSNYSSSSTATEIKTLAAKLASQDAPNGTLVAATADGVALETSVTLDDGYYLVIVTPSSVDTMVEPMLVQVTDGVASSDGSTAKTQDLTLTKAITKVGTDTTKATTAGTNVTNTNDSTAVAGVGDTVSYTINTTMPKYAPTATSVKAPYIIDTPTNLTDDVDSISVTLDTTPLNTSELKTKYYTAAREGSDGFKITFKEDAWEDFGGKAITVTYNATVKSTAVSTSAGNPNTATLTYNRDYITGSGSGDDKTVTDKGTVYTAPLIIHKTDGTADLNGVKFTLKTSDGKYVKSDGTVLTNSDADKTTATYTTAGTGLINYTGLKDGTYTLTEEQGADDHRELADSVTVSIEAGKVSNLYNGSYTVSATATGTGDDTYVTARDTTVTIVNPPINSLPGTGGMGTVLFTVGGAAIVLAAGAMFVVYMRKRKNEEQ